jgi:hypothetical protein
MQEQQDIAMGYRGARIHLPCPPALAGKDVIY